MASAAARATMKMNATAASKVGGGGGNKKQQFSGMGQVVLQWSLGMFVSTPIIALLQGTYHLSEYRTHYSDAPRPAMPARGVAVAVERGFRPHFLNRDEEPLRLLVVGDSLAAGVGMSKSGTPVLPESIARGLSKAYGGRPVYWTCVGTPGVSASQIVQDIHQIESPSTRPSSSEGRLERLYREWKAKRRKWQERQALRRRLTELEVAVDAVETDDDAEESRERMTTPRKNRNFVKDWWDALRQDPAERNPKRVQETTGRLLQEWWSQVTTRLKVTRERVQEDLTEIKEIVQTPATDDDDDEGKEKEILHKGNAFRRDSLDPEIAAEYDIAVVLTGLNDLKDAFMPHMTKGAASSLKDGTDRIVGGLRQQLKGIVDALEQKMDLNKNKMTNEDDETQGDSEASSSTKQQETSSHAQTQDEQQQPPPLRRPLVVVPELPIAPLRLFHLVPLCWFLIPLFRAMENNKKFLSASFPDYVVFIPQPDLQWWSDVEAGLGPIRENIRSERLLLRSTDVTRNARERIQKLMRQFYYPDGEDDEDEELEEEQQQNRHRDEHHPHHPHHHSDHHVVPTDRLGTGGRHGYSSSSHNHHNGNSSNSGGTGSSYVAIDKMHPNDEGYELWGRHIAAAILEHRKS